MPQTFYIEPDEEIISIIGRLRKSSAEENIFVFPKHALVLQSIVSLRLFQREAEKLRKKIVIVSQDETGRMLAERAGVMTESYSEDFSRKGSHLELVSDQTIAPALKPSLETVPLNMLRSDAIGSSSFYSAEEKAVSLPEQNTLQTPARPQETQRVLRVRNTTPEKLTSLNSQRTTEIPTAIKRTSVPLQSAQAFSPAPVFQPVTPQVTPSSLQSRPLIDDERNSRLKNFYNGTRATPPPTTAPKEQEKEKNVVIGGRKAHSIFFTLGILSLVLMIGVIAFIFLPKAEVHVTPYIIVQPVDVEMMGRTGDVAGSDEASIPLRILAKDIEVISTVTTTGKSSGVNQKARGSVIIYNTFSTEPQSLVATTRLETADGKLFRLVNGVTVPGMTNTGGQKEAGVIEALVVADQSGEEYNIDPTTFTIPGFKGSPKYSAFSAKSTKAMIGGGDTAVSDVTVVAKVDLDTAEREVKEQAKEMFLNEMRVNLGADEKILDSQIDIVSKASPVVPDIGTALHEFEYKNTFTVRAFVFSEKAVREKIESVVPKEKHGIALKLVSFSTTYSESVANFSEETVRLRAHALVTMESDIDPDALRQALLGQSKDAIQDVLNTFPAIKTINVIFRPEWFIRSIPSAEERIIIFIEPGEAME